MLQIEPIPCRECGGMTCHIPVEDDSPIMKYDGLCPKCAMRQAAKEDDTSMLDALVDVASQAVKLSIDVVMPDMDEEPTAEHIYTHIMEFLRRYPELRKRMQYELNNAEIVASPVVHNDPRYG